MTNKMPMDISGKVLRLFHHLLNLVFAEVPLPNTVRFFNKRHRMGFGDRQKQNISRKRRFDICYRLCYL